MKKKTKFSLGMKIVTLLTVITMASVGFAAWVITAPITDEARAGTIEVETARDESITLEVKWVKSYDDLTAVDSPVIQYGADFTGVSEQEKQNAWLTNDNADFTENLVAYLSVKVTSKSTTKSIPLNVSFKAFTGDIKTPTDETTKFASAISNGHISAPMLSCVENDGSKSDTIVPVDYANTLNLGTIDHKNSVSDDDVVKTFIIKVQFGWGANFSFDDEDGGDNPYKYMATHSDSYEEYGSTIVSTLNSLQTAINGLKYMLTVSAK